MTRRKSVSLRLFLLGVLALNVISCGHSTGYGSGSPATLMNAVDPMYVHLVSKMHSCLGHAYPAQNSPNSGKHYFFPSLNYVDTGGTGEAGELPAPSSTNKIIITAPCDGVAKVISPSDIDDRASTGFEGPNATRGLILHFFCSGTSTGLRFFHIIFDQSILNQNLKTGDTIGSADVRCTNFNPDEPQFCSDFDIAVSDSSDDHVSSYFDRLDPAELKKWTDVGLDIAETIKNSSLECGEYNTDQTDWMELTNP